MTAPWLDCETLSGDVAERFLRALRRHRGKIRPAAIEIGYHPDSLPKLIRNTPGLRRDIQLIIDDCEVQVEIGNVSAIERRQPIVASKHAPRVLALHREGVRQCDIARELGVSHQAVSAAIKRAKARGGAPRQSAPLLVLDALLDEPMTAREIAETMGIALPVVHQAISRLRKAGRVEKGEKQGRATKWRLPCSQE